MFRPTAAAAITALLLAACNKAPDLAAATPTAADAPSKRAASAPKVVGITWVKPVGTDVDTIFAQAKASNKPVYLYWGAVWCPPCNQIKATVFNRPDFIERSQGFVPVYLDGDTPGAQKLGARFKVRGYPTMILFTPDGTELTRIPGEVDAAKYMQVLAMGLAAASPIKQSLANALGGKAASLNADAWRLLAYYSWDTDEAQLVPQKEVAATLQKLAQACPAEQKEAASRLKLQALAAMAKAKSPGLDKAAALQRIQAVLADAAQSRENFDVLFYRGDDLIEATTAAGSAERQQLTSAWNAALDKLAVDDSLSKTDRLTAVYTKVQLAKLGLPKEPAPKLPEALVAQARAAALQAEKTTTDRYERQAIIPGAADVLSEVGLLDESDAMLKAELAQAVSPYYHMLVLAANAKNRGDKAGSLQWAERAYNESQGPATRLQWGVGYVNKLIDLSPQDTARIEKAASSVIGELEAVPETFYERNRRGLERLGQKLNAWSAKSGQPAVLKKLHAELDTVCAKLPTTDPAHAACVDLFKAKSGAKAA